MIDNRWYDNLGDKWWERSGPVGALHDMNPARFDYFQRVLGPLKGLRVLDVGCGGGLLAECFSEAGAVVTGCDLSFGSLIAARRHGKFSRAPADYVASRGESLPFAHSSFDAVVSSDFLEHVTDLDRVLVECARVLKRSGMFLYETINRTLKARLIVIWLFERVLRVIPKHTHDPAMFIVPRDLHAAMARHSLSNRETLGLVPSAGLLGAFSSLVSTGRIGAFRVDSRNLSISYLGYGEKTA
jgi:2-polyprenyl-6-hydroxyphenyl methylase / 3-demethylubiquinone-9 3-methyltransferase